jgi:hypothetical protein
MEMKWSALMSILVICSMIVSVLTFLAVPSPNSVEASTSSWSPNSDPAGKREAVYVFNHWGETYLKNERWNRTNVSNPLTVSMAELGHHGVYSASSTRTHGNPTGMGVSDWLNGTGCIRQSYYGEYAVRSDRYPYIFADQPYAHAGYETPGLDPTTGLDWITWIPYRITGTIKNESMARTGSDAGHAYHAWFVPHLGPNSKSGGYINCSYYGTYLTDKEIIRIKTPSPPTGNVHYASWYYGVPGGWVATTNDGYFYELQGKIQYSRQAAIAYLGYSDAAGDARTWFNANKAAIQAAWLKDWTWNGSEPAGTGSNKNSSYRGVMGIYTGYEYDLNNSGMFNLMLKLDTANSTYRTLTIRLYSISWGIDTLMLRMMERCNVTGWWTNSTNSRNIRGSMTDYHEDLYWNISAGPDRANMFFRMVNCYRCTAWEDPSSSVFMGGWMLEVFHPDYVGNGAGNMVPGTYWSYPSPYQRYDPDMFATDRTTMSQVPGTRRYQKNASYWMSPVVRNFSKYECFVFDLNTSHYWGTAGRDFIGINPTWVGDPTQSTNGILTDNINKGNFTKNMYWGRLKLGDYCTPFPIVKGGNAYNNVTQVLNISGGSATGTGTVGIYMEQYVKSGRDYWTSDEARAFVNGKIWAHGMPFIQLDVVPVDNYMIDMRGAPGVGTTSPIRVLAVNGTGVVVNHMWGGTSPAWNGTVRLTTTDTGAIWGANGSSHAFVPSDSGVWWTSITWNTFNNPTTITASDRTNSTTSFTDVWGRISIVLAQGEGPCCTITSPTSASSYLTNWGWIQLKGTASDDVAVTSVNWTNSLGGSGTAYGTTSWQSRGNVQLSPGVNVITVNAFDSTGFRAIDTLTVTYDTVLPICTITSPTSNPTYSTSSATINLGGIASDSSGIATVIWKNMATSASGTATGTTSWTITGIALNLGMNLIYVNASDMAGNKRSDAIWVTYSIDTLNVTITDPTANSTMTTGWHMIYLKGTASDDVKVTNVVWSDSLGGSGIAYMVPQFGGASVTWQSRGNVHLLPGDNVITVTAYDNAGNSKTDVLTVTYTGP